MTVSNPRKYAYAAGRYIYLRYLTTEDAVGDWHLWFNSPEITKNLDRQRWINTPEDQLQFHQGLCNSRERLALAVIDRATDKLIGTGSISMIDYVNRRGEISLVIGAKEYHQGYYAMEAVALITEIGLVRLNLHKLTASGLETSERGLKINRLLGYKEIGRSREHSFVEGVWTDNIMLEIFQRDWLKSSKRPRSLYWNESLNEEPSES